MVLWIYVVGFAFPQRKRELNDWECMYMYVCVRDRETYILYNKTPKKKGYETNGRVVVAVVVFVCCLFVCVCQFWGRAQSQYIYMIRVYILYRRVYPTERERERQERETLREKINENNNTKTNIIYIGVYIYINIYIYFICILLCKKSPRNFVEKTSTPL